ncbi:hypothetical protein HMPREF0208_01550 [Citrobacter koseri]|nr:hypothetical protein HMPREF3220_04083 [Citrobacter koseri]KXA05385.1 hypothetical protein HMPREF3207_00867 [Citrobacter koseri]KXB44986.1 hypothetical protein HMPREF0208_01550 [Citrobacter koseri]
MGNISNLGVDKYCRGIIQSETDCIHTFLQIMLAIPCGRVTID